MIWEKFLKIFFNFLELTESSDCLLHGFLNRLGGPFQSQWQRKYFYLFPNRIEWRGEQMVGLLITDYTNLSSILYFPIFQLIYSQAYIDLWYDRTITRTNCKCLLISTCQQLVRTCMIQLVGVARTPRSIATDENQLSTNRWSSTCPTFWKCALTSCREKWRSYD